MIEGEDGRDVVAVGECNDAAVVKEPKPVTDADCVTDAAVQKVKQDLVIVNPFFILCVYIT